MEGATLSPAPRAVPWSVTLQLLLGGGWNTVGWLVLGFGMIFFWLFAWDSEAITMVEFASPTEIVEGTATSVQPTRASENDVQIFEVSYRFQYDGRGYTGRSYSVGPGGVKSGDKLSVEVVSGAPETSRIEGLRARSFGWGGAFVIVLPLMGIGLLSIGARKGRRLNRLLRRGEVAKGKLVKKEATHTEINEQPVMKLTFEFVSRDGRQHVAEHRTHRTALVEDEPEELILYDPSQPQNAVPLDGIPGAPAFIDGSGQWEARDRLRTLLVSILPAFVLGVHGVWAFLLS